MATANKDLIRLLGPVQIGESSAPLGGIKQRAMLAYLLLRAGEVVATERLVAEVWGERPPATATAIVHGYVRKLRAALADTSLEIVTRAPGYLLVLNGGELDIGVFEALAVEGREALRTGDASAARAKLSDALGLWVGVPLGDLPDEGFVAEERRRLERLHAEAVADRVDADLALGRSGELVAELEANVREQPFQERPRRQLMLALYRSGRQADALALYRDTRRLFVEELGIEPSKQLQELEQAILRHEETLDPPDTVASSAQARLSNPSSRSRWRLLGVAGLLAVCLAVAIPVALSGGTAPRPKRRPARILATVNLPEPSCCGFGFDAVWAVGHHDDILREVNPQTGRVLGRWDVAGFQSGPPLVAAGSIWVPSAAEALVRYDPRSKAVAKIDVQGAKVAFAYLSLWETTRSHQLDRIDLRTDSVRQRIRLAPGANNWDDELAVGEGAIWVAVADEARLDRVDPQKNRIVESINGFGSTDSGMPLAVDTNAVWVLRMVGGQETLFRVDPAANRIVKRINIGPPTGSAPTGTITTGGGYVWTGNWNRTVAKIDPRTNRVIAIYTLPDNPQNVTYSDGSLWVDSYDASKIWRIDPDS